MPDDAPVGEPQLARVALDDVEQGEAELRARVRVGALPHRARGARARAALGAEPLALDALAREDERGRQRVDDRLAERDVGLPRAHADGDHAPAADDGDARRLEVEHRTERDGREERDAPLAQQRRVAAAERVDDERGRARGGPRTVGDRPREPGHARGEHGAMERVAIAADARERLHRGGRRVLGGGQRARGASEPLGAAGREQGERGRDGVGRRAGGCGRGGEVGRGPRARGRGGDAGSGRRGRGVAADRRDRLARALDRAGRRPARLAVVRHVDRRLGADVQDVAGGELRGQVQPGLGGEEVGVAGLGEREREVVEVAAAQRERGRGGVAEDRELGLDLGDHAARATSGGRGSAAGSARRRGPRARRAARRSPPSRPAAAARPSPGVIACEAWTSSAQPRRELRVGEQRRERRPGEREREVGGHAVVRGAGGGAVRARQVGRARPRRDDALQRVVDRGRTVRARGRGRRRPRARRRRRSRRRRAAQARRVAVADEVFASLAATRERRAPRSTESGSAGRAGRRWRCRS